MRVPTNLHSLLLGSLITALLTLALRSFGIAFGPPDPAWMPPPDWELGPAMLTALEAGLAYLLMFSAGHLALRRHGRGGVLAYGTLGALVCLGVFALVLPISDWRTGLGALRLAAAIAGTGALLGVLYVFHARYAGRDWRAAWRRHPTAGAAHPAPGTARQAGVERRRI